MSAPSPNDPRHERLLAIQHLLACPACRASLSWSGNFMRCTGCAASYPVRNGVPILLPDSMQEPGVGTTSPDDPVSRHPYSPSALEIVDASPEGWVLDLGAGGKHMRWDRVVQIDIFRYPMTDVVCTADCLPFKDNAFRAVVSQAVFEHLQYPEGAAAEVRRVLQPGGIAKIDTAFLQPEHGYPHHFFNATEIGLRHWFRDFDIRWSGVEAYQHPQWSLSWFLGVYLDRIGESHAEVLRQAPIGEVLQVLERLSQGRTSEADANVVAALNALPPHELRTLAAGVSVHVVNLPKITPPGLDVAPAMGAADASELARQQIALRDYQALASRILSDEQERRIIALDRGNYLAQFYPDFDSLEHLGLRAWTQFRIASVLRVVLPADLWFHLRALIKGQQPQHAEQSPGEGKNRKPFLTIVIDPCEQNALINAFFSLVHQTFTDWELLLIERPGQKSGVRRALRDFARLDERVRVLRMTGGAREVLAKARAEARGDFVINLPKGFTLAFRAIATMVTLARQRPQTSAILADFEHSPTDYLPPRRCHVQGQAAEPSDSLGLVAYRGAAGISNGPALEKDVAYIPEVLYRHIGKWHPTNEKDGQTYE